MQKKRKKSEKKHQKKEAEKKVKKQIKNQICNCKWWDLLKFTTNSYITTTTTNVRRCS